MNITYNTEGVDMPPIDPQAVTQWVAQVVDGYGYRVGDVNFIFVSDEVILRINRQFVHHDYYTDHIGFDYSQAGILSGDIYISLDTVRTNAQLYGAPSYYHELHRVIIHGVLHLCGIEDKEPAQRQAMQRAEDEALRAMPRDLRRPESAPC